MERRVTIGRREVLLGIIATSLAGCAGPDARTAKKAEPIDPQDPYEQSRQRMRHKFGDLGAELRVDAFKEQEFYGVQFFPEGSDRPFYSSSTQTLRNRSIMSMPLEIPERVRIVWRESNKRPIVGKYGHTTHEDPIIGTDTIDVGSRIPQEVIDSIRREGGGLRLKFRLSNDGVYFGWDIERRPGYDPNKKDSMGQTLYVPPAFSMTGGDFKESRLIYYTGGEPTKEKGWYIDKKTGRRVETDY